MDHDARTRALYNGDCPVCDKEMCHYARYSSKAGMPLAFEDLNKVDLNDWGVTADEATRLMHVMHEGTLYVGLDALLILWEQMPRYRWIAWLIKVPGIYQTSRAIYTHVIARAIYNRHQRRVARGLVKSA